MSQNSQWRQTVILPPRETDHCLACGEGNLSLVEAVSITAIADGWVKGQREVLGDERLPMPITATEDDLVKERAGQMTMSASPSTWLDWVQQPIGTDAVRFDRCARCGLEMSSPRKAWDADIYALVYAVSMEGSIRWEYGRCLEDLGSSPQRILELGCGTCEFLTMAHGRGHLAIGLDFSAVAKKKAQDRGFKVVRDFEELRAHVQSGEGDQFFDAIVMFHTIEHLPDPESIFHQLNPFVRIGTKLIVSCPGPRRFTRLIREHRVGTRDFWDYPPHHMLRWTIPALHAFFGRRGWRVHNAQEEPLHWVGASSYIGVIRALRGGYIDWPFRRRLAIAWARLQTGLMSHWLRGLSIYVVAEKVE